MRSGFRTRVRWMRAGLGLALLGPAACARHQESSSLAWEPDSIPEAYARPSGALMWPGAARAWYVTPAGYLYNGDWEVRILPASAGVPAGRRRP